MAHFDDVIMPTSVRFGSQSVPVTSTQQVFLTSGYRKANQRWSQKLQRLGLIYVRGTQGIHHILKIWHAMEGPANTFLAEDAFDWNTTDGRMDFGDESLVTDADQPLRNTADNTFVGDGSTTTFQMVKRYLPSATSAHTRVITKPRNGTVKVSVDGVALTEGGSPDDFTVDYATGIVTFANPPGAGVSPTGVPVKWGGAFYVPVHFLEDDGFVERLLTAKAGELPGVELLQARLT